MTTTTATAVTAAMATTAAVAATPEVSTIGATRYLINFILPSNLSSNMPKI